MNFELLAHLPDDMKERYRKLESVFNSPGWPLIVEYAETRRNEAQQRQLHASTWDQALLNRGQAEAYGVILALENIAEQSFTHIAEENRNTLLLQDEAEHE